MREWLDRDEALTTLDSVNTNDVEFGSVFPYLALPHVGAVNGGGAAVPETPTTEPAPETTVAETSGTTVATIKRRCHTQ